MCLYGYGRLSSIFDDNFKQIGGPTTIEQIICSSNNYSCNEDSATNQEKMASGDATANEGAKIDEVRLSSNFLV
jgi:hypothetical protein